MQNKRSKILIADDIKSNINILIKLLEDEYDLSFVQDGESVLDYVKNNEIDLILLDILMPGIDGYEVCRKLKENEKTKNIPIIYITSKSTVEDEAKGLSMGAVDYITKPFSFPIVKARVKTHLALKNALEDLKANNEELIEFARLREDVERITRHDLKSPLVSIIGYSEYGLLQPDLDSSINECLETIRESGYKMLELINLSLDLVKMERGSYVIDYGPVDLIVVIKKILKEFNVLLMKRKTSPVLMIEQKEVQEMDQFIVFSEELLLYSMLSNLIKNAIEASPREEKIKIELEKADDFIIKISNKGVVPEKIRDTFFDKYSTAGKKAGTGLGTYSAKLIVEIHGGTIDYTSSEQSGTTVITHLPMMD